jgi:haloacid dehalogenase-like hydrolase
LPKPASAAFLLDVDNTLLDNDGVKQHLQRVLVSEGGEQIDQRFWALYEEVRADLGAVSVPVTLERLREESADPAVIDRLGRQLFDAPFADFVFPETLDLLRWLRGVGVPVILSDGDPWFQAKKITDAGLGETVGGNVLIFLHKEEHAADIRRWYPAEHYVAIDDKADLLQMLKQAFGPALQTVWVKQGHYAAGASLGEGASPDATVNSIGEVRAAVERLLAR